MQALLFQSDFGRMDGAVSAMYGVAVRVEPALQLYDLTHDIPPFHIREASYRLFQTIPYWPEHTVVVSVVDPGVGSDRQSVAVRTASNHIIVTPDNGTLTHLAHFIGISEAYLIDESINRLENSYASHTFHGRDVYAYTGAKLASGRIHLEKTGPAIAPEDLQKLSIAEVTQTNHSITGSIEIIDQPFGNLWTNINAAYFKEMDIAYGDLVHTAITHQQQTVFEQLVPFGRSFADAAFGEAVIYVNSLLHIGLAANQRSLAEEIRFNGQDDSWKITLTKA